jgi:hypothetical protein
MRNRIVLLAVVIGLLVGAAGVGLLVVTDEDDGTSVAADLPKLPIGAFAGERAMAAGAATDMMLAMPVEWRVRGELPNLDDHATAYRVGQRTSEATVAKLAAALGITAKPSATRDGWTVAQGDQRLFVGNGSWNYGADANCAPGDGREPDMAVSCASGSVSSVVAPCPPDAKCQAPTPPSPPADLPSKEEAQRIALRTFDAAGIDATGHVETFGPGDGWEVMAEPKIDGRRVFGAGNNLSVGPKGVILRGGGQLIDASAIGDYPLVTTTKGFERLKEQWGSGPVPMRGGAEPAIAIAPGEPAPDGGPVPEPQQPVVRTITGVTVGLQPTFGRDTSYLAPVFLFETDDGGVVPVPAVVDELLQQPGGGGVPEPAPAPVPGGPPQQVDPAPPSAGGGSSGSTGSSEACAGSASGSSAGGDPNQPMAVEVCASPSNPRVGETVTFSLKASDPDAAIDTDGCSQPRAAYGDEQDKSVSCMSICQKDNPSPESTTLAKRFTHAYAKPGPYKAVFTVGSCAPKASTGTVAVEITVRG